MQHRWLAGMLALLVGCGTLLNNNYASVTPPPGASVNGAMGPTVVSNQRPVEVIYSDGRRCILETRVSAGYVVADILLTFLVGVIVDAATGKWSSLDATACPGVIVSEIN